MGPFVVLPGPRVSVSATSGLAAWVRACRAKGARAPHSRAFFLYTYFFKDIFTYTLLTGVSTVLKVMTCTVQIQ